MSTFLFNELIFGPIHSRRLGHSLGINLLPTNCKYCNFECVYCECGNSMKSSKIQLPKAQQISEALNDCLAKMIKNNQPLDSITFAGNGEPTIHPDFAKIVDIAIQARNKYFPLAKVSVLSNATMINNPKIVEALNKVDNNILKLDSAIDATVVAINRPNGNYSVEKTINLLKQFEGRFTLQTMFLEGEVNGIHFNNTCGTELEQWLNVVKTLKPQKVMIYTIARQTPEKKLRKATHQELMAIKQKLEQIDISVMVSE